jgi:RimJ/RimL family protein N-acetyltransferase
MIELTHEQIATLRPWFRPERAGRQVGLHVITTGHGACLADRWPDPRAILINSSANYALAGDPAALTPAMLQGRIAGFVDAWPEFEPLLGQTFDQIAVWPRVIFTLAAPPQAAAASSEPRRLSHGDAGALEGLDADLGWISSTWGGPAELAASGYAWGAFVGGELAAVACTFYVGEHYEEVGVVTEPAFRGQGLSGACAAALCQDIQGRGRRPCWNTSPDNQASIRVAEKLGFTLERRDRLSAIGVDIPPAAQRPGA